MSRKPAPPPRCPARVGAPLWLAWVGLSCAGGSALLVVLAAVLATLQVMVQ